MPLEIFTILYSNIKHTFVCITLYIPTSNKNNSKTTWSNFNFSKPTFKIKIVCSTIHIHTKIGGENTEYLNKFTIHARKRG